MVTKKISRSIVNEDVSCNVNRKIFAAVKLTKKQRFIFSLGWPIHIIKIFD